MKLKKPKYIFVTGGVASSLGKGIISASIARLLQARGYTVTIQKLDPYINIDPGTLNPYEHGECYVTEDGTETDLDLGHYERFTSITTSKANNVTTGKIYKSVIEKERRGDYLGKTVQVIPHITDEIKRRIQLLAQQKVYDIIITELGGTVGDIESLPFIESVRQLRYALGYRDTALVHLTLIPYMAASGELKTKPTQHSVKALMENGLQPDILVLRTERALSQGLRRKVALFCNVDANAVMESIDVPTIYEVPLRMHDQHLDEVVLSKLDLPADCEPDMEQWKAFVEKVKNPHHKIEIALVGKYTELPDAYKSISEAFIHAGAMNDCKVKLRQPRHRGEDRGREVCPRARRAVHGHLSGYAVRRDRVRAQRIEDEGCQFDRNGAFDQASGHRPDGGAEGCDGQGRHDASGRLSLPVAARFESRRRLRCDRHRRAAPPPLRVQQRLSGRFRVARHDPRRRQSRNGAGRGGRADRSSVVRRHAVSSRVQEYGAASASPVRGLRGCGVEIQW